jgi:hypothetical protein
MESPGGAGRAVILQQEHTRIGEMMRFRFNRKGARIPYLSDPMTDE